MSSNTTAEEYYFNAKYDAIVAFDFTYFETTQTKLKASIVNGCCGFLSLLSSVLVLFIIRRSREGLSSTHHRFLFAIGISDFISSLAIAMSTLLMPKDMIYTQFEGRSFGNFFTCSVQGFCAQYFSGVMIYYNCGLCFYYLCMIPFQMSKERFQKRVEPFIHIGVQLLHLPIEVAFLYLNVSQSSFEYTYTCSSFFYLLHHLIDLVERKMKSKACCAHISFYFILHVFLPLLPFFPLQAFNPSPYMSWPVKTVYPFYCPYGEEYCTLRGGSIVIKELGDLAGLLHWIMIGLAILSMVIIAWYVYRQHKLLQTIRLKSTSDLTAKENKLMESRQEACAQRNKNIAHVFCFAVAYTVSCLMAGFPGTMLPIFYDHISDFWRQFLLAMIPSAGVVNMLVFVAEKVYHQRNVDRQDTFSQALWKIVTGEAEERDVLLSNIRIVRMEYYRNTWRRQAEIDFQVDDSNDEDDDGDDNFNIEKEDEQVVIKHRANLTQPKSSNESFLDEVTSNANALEASNESVIGNGSSMSRLSSFSSLNSTRFRLSGSVSLPSALSYSQPDISEQQHEQDGVVKKEESIC